MQNIFNVIPSVMIFMLLYRYFEFPFRTVCKKINFKNSWDLKKNTIKVLKNFELIYGKTEKVNNTPYYGTITNR